jgi:membrane protein implicated in regulation of membrane protease activity
MEQFIQGVFTMSNPTVWWLLAGITVAIELATGTFYLLMISIGLAAAAVAAHLGLLLPGQLVTAAVVGGGAVVLWHWQGSKKPEALQANANPDVHMDIGELVTVTEWQADGTASVNYRGAHWTAVLAHQPKADAHPAEGQYRIKEMSGNRLLIESA